MAVPLVMETSLAETTEIGPTKLLPALVNVMLFAAPAVKVDEPATETAPV